MSNPNKTRHSTTAMHLIDKIGIFFIIACISALWSARLAAAESPKDSRFLRESGTNYELGRNVKRDYKRAYRLYCMAAIKGDIEANYHLGWLYFNGRGIQRDTEKAAYWFKQGAMGGDRTAKNMLGLLAHTRQKKDNSCLKLSQGKNADRAQIEAWVHEWAPKYGLDTELVLAVIRVESNFDPMAWSDKDARGLMQLLPTTAKRFGVSNSWDPIDNMRGGMAYLQWLIQHFQGDVRLVLAAYNAGENAVERHNGVPPYNETINYVRRITQTYPKTTHPVPSDTTNVTKP